MKNKKKFEKDLVLVLLDAAHKGKGTGGLTTKEIEQLMERMFSVLNQIFD